MPLNVIKGIGASTEMRLTLGAAATGLCLALWIGDAEARGRGGRGAGRSYGSVRQAPASPMSRPAAGSAGTTRTTAQAAGGDIQREIGGDGRNVDQREDGYDYRSDSRDDYRSDSRDDYRSDSRNDYRSENRNDYRPDAARDYRGTRPVYGQPVTTLPADTRRATIRGRRYYYWGGAYYVWNEPDNVYVTVETPVDAYVEELPGDCSPIVINEQEYYLCGEEYYRQVYYENDVWYQRVEVP